MNRLSEIYFENSQQRSSSIIFCCHSIPSSIINCNKYFHFICQKQYCSLKDTLYISFCIQFSSSKENGERKTRNGVVESLIHGCIIHKSDSRSYSTITALLDVNTMLLFSSCINLFVYFLEKTRPLVFIIIDKRYEIQVFFLVGIIIFIHLLNR